MIVQYLQFGSPCWSQSIVSKLGHWTTQPQPYFRVKAFYINVFFLFLSLLFIFAPDTSWIIPTPRTDQDPQTEKLLLPERDKRHNSKIGTAKQDSPSTTQSRDGREAPEPNSTGSQQQSKSGQSQTVTTQRHVSFSHI